jgi:hypothetical protein
MAHMGEGFRHCGRSIGGAAEAGVAQAASDQTASFCAVAKVRNPLHVERPAQDGRATPNGRAQS